MTKKSAKEKEEKPEKSRKGLYAGLGLLLCVLGYFIVLPELFAGRYDRAEADSKSASTTLLGLLKKEPAAPTLDKADYDRRMVKLANYASSTASTTASTTRAWPTNAPYPLPRALLPFHRIVAYYGNFYSTAMGILGQDPPSVMIPKLQAAVASWNAADPSTPAIPAIDYIAVTAQGSPGADNKYRLRMPGDQIQKAIDLADQVHGIVILDVQVGDSDLPSELPRLEPYLKLPNVHLAIDPEFAMHGGVKPGTVIGTMSSVDVNYAATFLQKIVQDNNLPPKILVVHRFTEGMVTGTKNIRPLPEVQIVMDMDGWGFAAKKINTYKTVITNEPVQFAGFKLFYKNDLKPPSTRMLTPTEVLKLHPSPIFIQYQ